MTTLALLAPLFVIGAATYAWLIVLSRRQRALSARLGLHVCRYPADDEPTGPTHTPITVAELLARNHPPAVRKQR